MRQRSAAASILRMILADRQPCRPAQNRLSRAVRESPSVDDMARRRGENRFVKYWLAPLALVVVAGIVAAILVTFQNSWWVDRGRPPSSDQRADDGTSVFTPSGVDYVSASGVLIVKVGPDSLPAAELGLDDDGARTIDPAVPVQVRVLGTDGAFVLDLADAVVVTTAQGRITRVELIPWGPPSFREMIALLESRAQNVGWTPADIAALQDDLAAAQQAAEGDDYAADLTGRDGIGATVSARITVDLAASSTRLTLFVAP